METATKFCMALAKFTLWSFLALALSLMTLASMAHEIEHSKNPDFGALVYLVVGLVFFGIAVRRAVRSLIEIDTVFPDSPTERT